MSTWIQDLKARSRKSIKSPITGSEFTIRKLTNTQITEAGLSAIINVDAPKDATASLLAMARQADQVVVAQTRFVVETGVVEPKISYGEEDKVPDNTVHASWISEDERWLYLSVLEFSGVANDATRVELEKYTKNAPGSVSSIESAAVTGDSLTSSSETTSGPAN